jgi:predicted AAA+ superfamily ATPase
MERSIERELKKWKEASHRYPLLLRGARQVGKSYIVEKLGKSFESFEMVNFEAQPEAMACFEMVNPLEIVQKLELLTKRKIQPGITLLFLDEIQACPKAILALRYFKEKMPDLHVIGAGSLLEFTLIQGQFSFPVGRVQFIYLHPLSFREFALGLEEKDLIAQIEKATIENPPSAITHQKLIQRMKEYFLIGGMPAVIDAFKHSHSFLNMNRIQDLLLSTYRADFSKYASEAEQKYLKILFERIAYQIGQQFKYSEIDPHMKSRDLKMALEHLQQAGLVHLVYSSSASGIPLAAQIKQKRFKSLFIDIGLVERALQVDPETILSQDLIEIHSGALAEQFVGQEFIAYADFYREEKLFFWEREKKSSSAEVDYVITLGQHIFPVEVKAGAHGHLKSLMEFMKEKNSHLGIRISQRPLSYKDGILSVPLYMIEQIPRLVKLLIGEPPTLL